MPRRSRSLACYRILLYADESGVIDIPRLQQFLELSRKTLNKYVARLAREGLVEKRGERVYLTSLGLKMVRTLRLIREGKTAPRYVLTDPSTGNPIPMFFSNHLQLYALLAYNFVDEQLLEHHLRNYMEAWFRDLGDEFMVELIKMGKIKSTYDLRNYLEKLLLVSRVLD
ncbi:MAG: MarR family transcriptional regulator [Desulfurococcaceae archaeon]